MIDIDNRLKEYRINGEIAIKKNLEDYETLRDMELEYCALINEGNAIRKYLLENPELLDEGSYFFLSNKVSDPSVLSEKFYCLQLVLFLSKKLYDTYCKYVQVLLEHQEYDETITIYEALYNLTFQPMFKKSAADVYYQHLNNTEKALEIYLQIEQEFKDDPEFLKHLSLMCSEVSNIELAEHYKNLAQEKDLNSQAKDFVKNNEHEKAVELYTKLYEQTKNPFYKLEVANIVAVIFENINEAIKLYKELENELSENIDYWYKLSELYEYIEDYFNQVLCMQKAIKMELGAEEFAEGEAL